MDVKDRIKLLMDSAKMSQQDFARMLGITPGSLSGILNERTRPTNNHTLAIHKAFPNVSINWLLFGEGEMYTDPTAATINGQNDDSVETLSLFPQNGSETQGGGGSQEANVEPVGLIPSPVRNNNVAPEPIIIKRQVKEIRLFYDDGTYESFVSSEK